MGYQVRFVEDAGLPSGVEFAFVRLPEGATYLFVKQSAIDAQTGRCDALTRAWETWQAVEAEQSHAPRIRSEVGHLRNLAAVLLAAYGLPAMKMGSAVL